MPAVHLASLPGDWTAVGEHDATVLLAELRHETPPGHALDGKTVQPVAIKRHRKDTVWWLPDNGSWAHVHLTYSVETDPQWPSCNIYGDWDSLVADLSD